MRSSGRSNAFQRKRADMRFDCAMASETHVGRPTRHVEIAKNRAKFDPTTGARPDVEPKRPPNALRRGFGTSRGVRECPGAPGERPDSLRGRPGSFPGESRSVSGASPDRPRSPEIARQRPRATFTRFWLDFGSLWRRSGVDFRLIFPSCASAIAPFTMRSSQHT